ncbi:Sterol uptake control protein 2 [Lasiodiplodia hormozganensis]|uniref:Sterol uptake control protein 2 n=1 Tax=Lasiodiplodia hormozganensis TaxID=869390 RepID=A0AA39XQ42_9PEZI|nr:Sterol uptake control protein 2 [Lasiodiplodia hormozganensis]
MRLLHQFTSSTAFTVADGTEVQQTWKGSVIELAFDHGFLLHSILAFSALHMAHLHPQDKAIYGNVAARHQDKALSDVHSEIANITAHNCEALLAFSLLTVCYIPASKEASSDAPGAEICALFEWLNLIRGVVSVVDRGRRWIQTGPLAIWLKFFSPDLTGFTPLIKTSLEDDHKLRCLEELWDLISFDEMAECTHSDAQIEAALCKEALAQLRGAFSLAEVASFAGGKGSGATPNDEQYSSVVAASLIWLYKISDGFLRMILARRPSALILLLHNFILVKRLGGEKCWWAPLLAIQVVDAVTPLIPSKYNAFLLWPVEEIRGHGPRRAP